MSIAFPCENCGHRFEVEDSFAGKKCKCNKCGHKFLIPVPRQTSSSGSKALKSFGEAVPPAAPKLGVTASLASKSPTKPAAPAPDPYYSDDDPYGFDEAPLPSRGAVAPQEDEEFIPPRGVKPIAFQPKKKKKKSGDSLLETVPGWAYLAAGGVLGAMVVGAFISHALAGIVALVLPLCLGLMAVGAIGMLTVAFRESVGCGLLYIFLPFYSLYYLVTRWGDMKNWFFLYMSGMAPFMASGILLPAFTAAHQAADHARARDQMARGGFAGPENPFEVRPGFVPQGIPVPPPMPVNADEQVTLNITGLADNDSAEIFYGKLDTLSRRFNGGKGGRRSYSSGGRYTCVVWPIQDVQGFVAGINFAKVTKVDGRTISVTVEPLTAAERRPPDSDFIAQALFDLKSPAMNRPQMALDRLRMATPDQSRREEVSRAIETMLKDPDGQIRSRAARALKVWGGPESTPALVDALKDPEYYVVNSALEAMKALHDPAAAEAVADRLPESMHRGAAAEALKAMGPGAQAAVVRLLTHPDVFVRMEACRVLAEIGTTDETRLAVMDVWLRVNGHGLDAMAANETIKKIGKPQASPFKKKSTASNSSSPFKRKSIVPR